MSQDQVQSTPLQAQIDENVSNQTVAASVPDEIENLKKQCEEYLNGWKRAKADYINFQKDQEKHAKELASIASMGAVMQVIPTLENFRKAFIQVPDQMKESPWVKGIEQIYKQLKDALKTMGVEEYTGLVGNVFDPALHQAVGQEYIEAKEEDAITQEISAGYKLHGHVIIPAGVIVNKKPSILI